MSLKDLWQEVKQDRIDKKEQKKQQKIEKKKSVTGEQKAYRIMWAIFIVVITVLCFTTSCRAMSCSSENFNWAGLVGISTETIEEIKADVKSEDVLFETEIGRADWMKTIVRFQNANLNICSKNNIDKEKLDNIETEEFDLFLNGKELGALFSNLVEVYEMQNKIDLKNLKITGDINNSNLGVLESVSIVNLSDVLGVSRLPSVYLYTKSEFQVLQDKLVILDSEIKINNLSQNAMNEINNFIVNNKLEDVKDLANFTVCDVLNSFANMLDAEMSIGSNGLSFVKRID